MSPTPDGDLAGGAPRWVKVSGVVVLVVVVVLAVLMLATSGHGPGRHSAPAEDALRLASRAQL